MAANRSTAALTAIAWLAIVLAIYAALVILNIFFLVPDNPAHTVGENIRTRFGMIAIFALALAGLIALSRMCFAKRSERRRLDPGASE